MDNNKTGQLIAQMRKELGLTQKQLAEKLNISDRAVSKWERGAGFPDVSLLEPLADALGLNVLELLRGERMPEEERRSIDDITVREALRVLSRHGRRQTGYALKTVQVLVAMFAPVIIVLLFLFRPVDMQVSGESWAKVNVWTTDLDMFDLKEPEELTALAEKLNEAYFCNAFFRFDGGMPSGLIADISVLDASGKSVMRIELCRDIVYVSSSTEGIRVMELSGPLNCYLRELLEENSVQR